MAILERPNIRSKSVTKAKSESEIQSEILRYIENLPNTYVFKAVRTNKAGVPDIIGHLGGKFFAIEVKRAKGVVTQLQDTQLMQINTKGGYARVCTNLSEAQYFINYIQKDSHDKC